MRLPRLILSTASTFALIIGLNSVSAAENAAQAVPLSSADSAAKTAKPPNLSKPKQAQASADSLSKAAADSAAKLSVISDSTLKKPIIDTLAKTAQVDSIAKASDSASALAKSDSTLPDTASVKKTKRPRIVRETTVNTLDELKGKYRSPKKALFMSLVIPGAGQAYVGNSVFNFSRAALYLATDVGLVTAWYHYSVVKHARQVKRYRTYADEHWSLTNYENKSTTLTAVGLEQAKNKTEFENRGNYFREIFCNSVIDPSPGGQAKKLFDGCNDRGALLSDYQVEFKDAGLSTDSIGKIRAGYPDAFTFYELIGKEQEFVPGWDDVKGYAFQDSVLKGSSDNRNNYVDMRKTAESYSRMQAWFFGGIVLNHIVSAIDAALAARYHNRNLYESDVGFMDRIRLNSHIALENGMPKPTLTAVLTF